MDKPSEKLNDMKELLMNHLNIIVKENYEELEIGCDFVNTKTIQLCFDDEVIAESQSFV